MTMKGWPALVAGRNPLVRVESGRFDKDSRPPPPRRSARPREAALTRPLRARDPLLPLLHRSTRPTAGATPRGDPPADGPHDGRGRAAAGSARRPPPGWRYSDPARRASG